jgi:hypothetical protein
MVNRLKTAAKVALAGASVLAIVSIPARELVPNMTILQLAALLVCGFIALVALVVISLTLGQWVLRMGGTDAQWFWFPSEPRGLQQLREEARDDKRRQF